NIALANELAIYADEKNVNITEVIKASNSQPFSHIHQPGIGVGGHCIPIYPYFFINKELAEGLTHLSRRINDRMADYSLTKIEKEIGSLQGKNILILGLSYRENVKETTKSTTLMLIEQLKAKVANVFVNDPQFTDHEIESYNVYQLQIKDPFTSEIDIIINQAFHQEYEELDFASFIKCQLVFDGRNKLNKEEINKLGMKYIGVGN